MKVLVVPEVQVYMQKLVFILFEKGYFSYEDNARKYVKELYDDFKTNLPTRSHKPAPKHFDTYGKNMKYAGFPKNKRTTWYVFFTTYMENGEEIYLVRYIANNHTIAQYL
jgi:hypothetical protein